MFADKLGVEGGWSRLDEKSAETWDRAATPHGRWGVVGFSPDLVGFWVLWHAEGGFEGLRRLGMSETTIWRRVRAFRDAFGAHPDDYEFPGITIDLERYWYHPDGHGYLGNPALRGQSAIHDRD